MSVTLIITSAKSKNFSRRFAAKRIIDAPLSPSAHDDVVIFRFEDYLLQIQPESRTDGNLKAIDVETALRDDAIEAHDRGVITKVAGRTEPPPARFFTSRK